MSEHMLFCLGDGKYGSKGDGYQKNYQVFNKDVEKEEYNKIKNSLRIKISFLNWIDKKDMTDKEKENYPVYKEIGGYLKKITYEEAWSNWWNKASQTEKNQILGIKYFDPQIFKEITGIDTEVKETIIIGGITYDKKEVELKLKDIKPIKE